MASSQCPTCRKPLQEQAGKPIGHESCASCGAHFVDRVALDGWLDQLPRPRYHDGIAELTREPGSVATRLACPRCKNMMRSNPENDAIAGFCSGCGGTWVEPDGFGLLVEWRRGVVRKDRRHTALVGLEVAGDAAVEALAPAPVLMVRWGLTSIRDLGLWLIGRSRSPFGRDETDVLRDAISQTRPIAPLKKGQTLRNRSK